MVTAIMAHAEQVKKLSDLKLLRARAEELGLTGYTKTLDNAIDVQEIVTEHMTMAYTNPFRVDKTA